MVSPDTLLQVNATVIAGILILLAIPKLPEKYTEILSSHKRSKMKLIRWFVIWVNDIRLSIPPKWAVGIVVVPFSLSSIFIIVSASPYSQFKEFVNLEWAQIFAAAGFVYIIFVLVTLRTEEKNPTS